MRKLISLVLACSVFLPVVLGVKPTPLPIRFTDPPWPPHLEDKWDSQNVKRNFLIILEETKAER